MNTQKLSYFCSILVLASCTLSSSVFAQTSSEISQLLAASQNSWFGYSYRWKIEQITEITAESMKGQIDSIKKQLELLSTSDPDYANKKANLEYAVQAFEGSLGTNKAEIEVTALLATPSKWRIEYRFIKPHFENPTVYLTAPNGGALEYLNEQKILRYHESAKSVLADVLRGIPEFAAASHLSNLDTSKIDMSSSEHDAVLFISDISNLKYKLRFDPKTFTLSAFEELTGGETVMRLINVKSDGRYCSKQFNPTTGAVVQEQKWTELHRSPLGAISQGEFTAKIPDGFILELPEGDHAYKAVPIEGFKNLIFKQE